jgi:superfamily II DNA helicase RecQ
MNAYAPFDQLFDPNHSCFTIEAAERLIALRADEATQLRMEELAAQANEGTLSESERREYETCVRAGSVLSILQAKARLFMKRQSVAH